MLLNGSNFRVDSLDASTSRGGQANFASVSFQSSVYQSIDLALDVSSSFCIGKGLVGGRQLEAVKILMNSC